MLKKLLKLFFSIFAIAILFGVAYFYQNNPSLDSGQILGENLTNKLAIHFLDVGQGDAILIRTPDGDDILIDGGPDNQVVKKLGEYLPVTDRDIELIILTHPHSDHVVGLNEVINRYGVEKILMTGALHTSSDYLTFLNLIKEKNIPAEIINQITTIELGEVDLEILFPAESFYQKKVENLNNTSIVTKLVYASTSVMLTGDFENEELLIDSGFDLSSDILKAGHHGSNNANDERFIEAVNPDYVVVSCGVDNSFGHPHYRAVKNFERVGAEILRTDVDGDVNFYSDGAEFYKLL